MKRYGLGRGKVGKSERLAPFCFPTGVRINVDVEMEGRKRKRMNEKCWKEKGNEVVEGATVKQAVFDEDEASHICAKGAATRTS